LPKSHAEMTIGSKNSRKILLTNRNILEIGGTKLAYYVSDSKGISASRLSQRDWPQELLTYANN